MGTSETAPLKSAGAKDPVYKKIPAQDFTKKTLLHVHKVHKQSMKRGLNSFDGTITAYTIFWAHL